ncbi:MAG TPA: hypothetical protein PKW33_09035 [Anaerolineaceae bacterium]|nr:hypothetical protein [Anaerolineaceae bacterium]HPN51719.1 hypothetical protein [Anaerolineaceae bacterium]
MATWVCNSSGDVVGLLAEGVGKPQAETTNINSTSEIMANFFIFSSLENIGIIHLYFTPGAWKIGAIIVPEENLSAANDGKDLNEIMILENGIFRCRLIINQNQSNHFSGDID